MTIKDISRRGFLKCLVISGVSVYIAKPFSKAYAALFEDNILTSPNWDPKTKTIKYRTDAITKVTGQKIFAYDIRAKDMETWPEQQAHAFILRTTQADKLYEGFSLELLQEADLMPDRIVTAEDIKKDKLAFPEFFGNNILLPEGETPAYLGQAVAILIYNDFARYKFAKTTLKFKDDQIIKYGEFTGFLKQDPWSAYRGVRIGSENPYAEDVYSSMKDTTISPLLFKKRRPVWPDGKKGDELSEDGMFYANQLNDTFNNPPEDWLVLDREFHSQSVDLNPLEPNCSNGWYDAETESLHFVTAVQSPLEITQSIVEVLTNSTFKFKKLFLYPCFTVGYGTKDHAIDPIYAAIATMYGNGLPVRLANDRYEHFQTGLKRHAFDMKYKLAINKNTHKIEAFIGSYIGNGGGRCNYTPSVMSVGATATQGIYYIPKSDLTAVGIYSRAVDAGSSRGYGTMQSMPAFDTLMDEAAKILQVDPIEFRLKNLIKSGMKNTQGAIPGGDMRADEVLTACAQHPIWTEKDQRKIQFEKENPGKIFATGISCVQKDYGTGADAAFARIELSPEGKISLWHNAVEIGTGMSTSQAVLCAQWFGVPADHATFAVTEWPELPMVTSLNSFSITQKQQDALSASNPLWTPSYSSPSSASNSSYFFSHATVETGRLIFDYGIWPAALSIWSEGIGGGQLAPLIVRREDARWNEKGLTARGLEPLSLERLTKRLYEMKGVTGAVGHAFGRWQWAEADYKINKESTRRPLDGISLRYGDNEKYEVNKRIKAYMPSTQRNNAGVTYYTALATAIEISIDTATGTINVLNHHTVVECGNVIVPQLVSGQIEGGVAMGIGHALYEYLPLYEDGPGNGTWNFNRYHMPLANEVAVWTQTSEVLPPLSETDPAKGMAEVVIIPVVSAITNAVAAGTGHYFNQHPILPKNVLEILK